MPYVVFALKPKLAFVVSMKKALSGGQISDLNFSDSVTPLQENKFSADNSLTRNGFEYTVIFKPVLYLLLSCSRHIAAGKLNMESPIRLGRKIAIFSGALRSDFINILFTG